MRNADSNQLENALRTLGAAVDPGPDQFAQLLLGAGHGVAAGPRLPGPADEIVVRQMLVQQREIAAAVALRVLNLTADLAYRFALPRHLDRRQAPACMPWHALKRCLLAGENRDVAVHVAGAAGIAGHTAAVGAARDRRRMGVHVVALGRAVARRMAVHAARI